MLTVNPPPLTDPVLYNAWHVVALATSLGCQKPLQVHLLGEKIVLWRDGERIIACQDRCPHRGVSLAMGEVSCNHTLVCPYHAMEFDPEGLCTRIPADLKLTTFPQGANLRTYAVQEKYGFIWVALGEPVQEIPQFVEWGKPDTISFQCGPYAINTSAPRILENFVDIAHLPFIHRDLLGDPEFPEVSDYKLTVHKDEIIASDIHFYQPNPEGTGEAKSVTYVYKIVRPMVAWFRKGDDHRQFSIFIVVTPVEETRSIVWLGVARNYSPEVSNDTLRAFQDNVMAQDVPMVESQRPQKLPLDLQQEFHFPCDKMSIAYRKWLKQLGLKFGTC
ncbi:aromatic ring-hydroxylating dioxygenase subunit alpha [Leptothoe sp. PORK10 BA2]|uniref:aromatic ring-hydroxylating dioxygenase subunit alpha n=1 Tax=Leptothoe sp. PORK10 BA2 TaxID=3110254 RepID=UPI002B1F9179|nr:aromatic ring-hydroxylating dioxygenase subunit alpha [Leptothoe sp. PORK10 BA2]MEA5463750.1 aromatic ring-hydroxylating dioxygenase subunit alpha [Leptothoe sp. PORK10 BA2]